MGMAGRSHWSLSIAVNPSLPALEFDVACRPAGESEYLSSGYEATDSATLQRRGPAVLIRHPLGRCRLQPVAAEGFADQSVRVDDHGVFMKVEALRQAGLKTCRWQYRVSVDRGKVECHEVRTS
jgi:hypothetical protein